MAAHALGRAKLGPPSKDVLGQVAGGLAVAAITGVLIWILVGSGPALGLVGLALLGACSWLAVTRRPALALALFVVYLGALDGYLKLSTGRQELTFLRDLLLFSLVAGLLVRAQVRGTRLTAPPFAGWVAAFTVLVAVQVLNPQGGSLLHSLAGVRQHLEFVPLFFLTFAFVRTTQALRVFVVLILLVAAVNGVVSLIQFNLEPEQLAAWGPGYKERVLGTDEFSFAARTFSDEGGTSRTRPFGLGSEAGSAGIVGAFALGGIAALASTGRLRHLLVALVLALGAITAIVTSQGRGVVVASVVIVLAYGLLMATSRARGGAVLGLAVAGIVAVVAVQVVVGSVGGSSSLRYEGLTASEIVETTGEAREGNVEAIVTAITEYPLGSGLATAGPAAGTPGATAFSETVNAESQLSFSTYETGVIGMLLIVGFTVMLFGLGLRRLRDEPDREARLLLAALIAPLAGMLALYYPSALTATTPTGPYLWAVGGIVAYWLVARPAAARRAGNGAAGP